MKKIFYTNINDIDIEILRFYPAIGRKRTCRPTDDLRYVILFYFYYYKYDFNLGQKYHYVIDAFHFNLIRSVFFIRILCINYIVKLNKTDGLYEIEYINELIS